jgi:hypothetical protein
MPELSREHKPGQRRAIERASSSFGERLDRFIKIALMTMRAQGRGVRATVIEYGLSIEASCVDC